MQLKRARSGLQNAGFFLTVEGPNGVGKSVVVTNIVDQLCKSGSRAISTKEPTDSGIGILARNLEGKIDARAYACLVGADRYYHLDNQIIPALEGGNIVVSARYVESSLVLQRFDGMTLDQIWSINSQILIPQLSIILTASKKELVKRLSSRKRLSYFEKKMDPGMEIRFYLDAGRYLSSKGFNILVLSNEIDLTRNVNRIVSIIKKLAQPNDENTWRQAKR